MKSQKEAVRQRLEEKLERECGPVLMKALRDPAVVEVLLNPDGRLWVDVAGKGMEFTGHTIEPGAAESLLATCASMLQTTITRDNPILEGEFPLDGSRLEGIVSPIVRAPVLTIRKKVEDGYGHSRGPDWLDELRSARRDHRAGLAHCVSPTRTRWTWRG